MGLLLLWSIFKEVRFFLSWKQRRYPINISLKPKILVSLMVGILMSIFGLYLVPKLGDIPLRALPNVLSDIGYSIFVIVTLDLLNTLVKAFVKSAQQQ
jgi:uncharacterized membrane protein